MRSASHEANLGAVRDLTFQGVNALHHGQVDQAATLLQQAVQASPDDQRIRQHLADAMVQQGRVDAAIQQLQAAIESSPHDPRLYVELGTLHLSRNQPETALVCAESALKINRQLPCAWVLHGQCKESTRDLHAALASFHRAAALPDVSPDVQINIAQTYRSMDRPMQALNALELFTENYATDQIPESTVLLMADTLVDLKQTDRATEQLAQLTRRHDATPEAWLALSRIQSATGGTATALMTAQDASQLFPQDQRLIAWTNELSSQLDRPDRRTAGLPGERSGSDGFSYK